MTGKNKPSKWQDKHLRKLENLSHNIDFQDDLKHINLGGGFSPLYDLAKKHDVQPLLMLEYIRNRTILPSAVVPTISIICDEDETAGPSDSLEEAQFNYVTMRGFPHSGIELHIPPGSSQVEIMSFIKDNWPYIETKIGKPLRNKRQRVAERNTQIIRLHHQGFNNHEILEMVKDNFPGNLIIDDVSAIIRKNK